MSCIEQHDLKLFPFSSLCRSRENFAMRVEEKIFCICRKINNPIKGVIKCDSCCNWYHFWNVLNFFMQRRNGIVRFVVKIRF